MTEWPQRLRMMADEAGRAVRIVVAQTNGSTPREPGAVMIVSLRSMEGTIGGGRLELEAIMAARRMLEAPPAAWQREVLSVPLGPRLGQCCGGHATLVLEAFDPAEAKSVMTGTSRSLEAIAVRSTAGGTSIDVISDRKQSADLPLPVLRTIRDMLSGARPRETFLVRLPKGVAPWLIEPVARAQTPVFLYGAGHVGRAVALALAPLPFAVTWVDIDKSRFPDVTPANASPVITNTPARTAAEAPTDSFHLVMTFSHPLDLDICHAILGRGSFAYLGLIGSDTKAMRFRKRLSEAGIAPQMLDRLVCPIGLAGLTGKEPAVIAASVAADLLIRARSSESAICSAQSEMQGR